MRVRACIRTNIFLFQKPASSMRAYNSLIGIVVLL